LQGFEDDEFVIMFLIVPSLKRIKNPLQNSKFPNGFYQHQFFVEARILDLSNLTTFRVITLTNLNVTWTW